MKFKHTYEEYQKIFKRKFGEDVVVNFNIPKIYPSQSNEILKDVCYMFMFYLLAVEDSQRKIKMPGLWGGFDYLNKLDKKTYQQFFPELNKELSSIYYNVGYELFVTGEESEGKDVTECEGFSSIFHSIPKGVMTIGTDYRANIEIKQKNGIWSGFYPIISVARHVRKEHTDEYVSIYNPLKKDILFDDFMEG